MFIEHTIAQYGLIFAESPRDAHLATPRRDAVTLTQCPLWRLPPPAASWHPAKAGRCQRSLLMEILDILIGLHIMYKYIFIYYMILYVYNIYIHYVIIYKTYNIYI